MNIIRHIGVLIPCYNWLMGWLSYTLTLIHTPSPVHVQFWVHRAKETSNHEIVDFIFCQVIISLGICNSPPLRLISKTNHPCLPHKYTYRSNLWIYYLFMNEHVWFGFCLLMTRCLPTQRSEQDNRSTIQNQQRTNHSASQSASGTDRNCQAHMVGIYYISVLYADPYRHCDGWTGILMRAMRMERKRGNGKNIFLWIE